MTDHINVDNAGAKAGRVQDIAIAVGLVVLTTWIYAQVAYHDFILYDDPNYVTQNAHVRGGLTAANVVWAFTTGDAANWHPLTWLSHLLDMQCFGMKPMGHHLVSVLLHALNGALLFFALKRLTGDRWPSALVAALFVVHPTHVESVAWVAERKDVLSALFGFATLYAYARYAERPGSVRYGAVALLFAFGLMAKPMLVTLPFVLLLLDYWPLRRTRIETFARLALEKVPLLVLTVASSVITYVVQRRAEAVKSFEVFPWPVRVENGALSYVRYLGKAFWPDPLVVFYPHAGAGAPAAAALGAAIVLLAVTLLLWKLRDRDYLLVGWLWFLGTLVPVIGLVQVGTQSMADRYTYIPLTGVFMMLAWELAAQAKHSRPARNAIVAMSVVVVTVLAAVAWRQIGFWHDTRRLFAHAAECTVNNDVAYGNLAQAEFDAKRFDEAEKYADRLLAITPKESDALSLAGAIQIQKGEFARAESYLQQALALNPRNPRAHNNMAGALANQGKMDEAITHLEEAIRLDPGYEGAQRNLAAFRQLRAQQKP